MTAIDRRLGVFGNVAIKAPCRVATTGDLTLDGLPSVDGIALAAGDRVLARAQSDPRENGIYVADTGEWQRALDFNGARDIVQGTQVLIAQGNQFAHTTWELTATSPVIGVGNLTFSLLNGSGTSNPPEASFDIISALRLYQGPATTATVIARTTFGDGGGGAFAVKAADTTTPDDGALVIVDGLGRRWWRVYEGHANAAWWGVSANNSAAQNRAALNEALGADGPKYISLPDGELKIDKYVRVSGPNKRIFGSQAAVIKMEVAATLDDGGVYRVQPALVFDATADSFVAEGFTVDHRGMDWPVYPASDFTEEIFGGLAGDAVGCAVLHMADKGLLSQVNVLNGWDNGIGIGRFNESTGQQEAAPDQPCVSFCRTYNSGCGKHSWGDAPGGHYFQGAGIDVLCGTSFVVLGCVDFGSYNGFWADINGGATGTFTGCIAKNTQVGAIWSDTATGGNQPWNTGGFGKSISGAGTGWLKTPGGLAFYAGSYGVHFVNCQSIGAGLYGFVADYYASKDAFVGCRAVNSGASGFVFCGTGHKAVACVVEGACQAAGTTAPSGSVFPNQAAILVTAMSDGSVNIDSSVELVDCVVSTGQQYPDVSPPSAKFNYAVLARTRNGRDCKVKVLGGSFSSGTSGTFGTTGSSQLTALCPLSDQWTINSYGANAILNLQQGANSACQMMQDANGDVSITNYDSAGTITLSQQGNGQINFWSNGTLRLQVKGDSVYMPSLPTAAGSMTSGGLWRDAAASNVVKAVP